MARYTTHSGSVALAAATAKTVLQYNTGASPRRTEIVELTIAFDGVTASDGPALVQLQRQTGGTGTGTTKTVYKRDPADAAANGAAKGAFSAEPTGGSDIFEEFWVDPNKGLVKIPLEGIILSAVNDACGVVVTTATGSAPNCRASLQVKE